MEEFSTKDYDLNSFRSDIRTNESDYRRMIISGFNDLCSQIPSMEIKIKGIQNLTFCIKKFNIKLTRKELNDHGFYVLLHIYLHLINAPDPDLNLINMIIFILHFSDFVDISDIQNQKVGKNGVYRIVNYNKISFPYPTTVEVRSLIQPDSIQFLLNGLNHPILSENCLSLLTTIARNKKEQILNILLPPFFDFIQSNPNSHCGEIIFLYFQRLINSGALISSKVPELDSIVLQLMSSQYKINIYYSIRIVNLIFKKANESFSSFHQSYNFLIQNLPAFISSKYGKIIIQSIKFISIMTQISDTILLAVLQCLPLEFKKYHKEAFAIVSKNLDRVISLVQPNDIAAILQNCLLSCQYQVKYCALSLFNQIMNMLPIINLIDIEVIFYFLDDPGLAALVLPLIVSYVDNKLKNGDISALLEYLSNSIDQIVELTENENENIAKMATSLNDFYETHS